MYEKLEYLQMEYDKISFSSQFSAIPGAQFVFIFKIFDSRARSRESSRRLFAWPGEAYVVFIYDQDLSRQENLIL